MVCAVPLCALIDRARLQPMPAPAAAATTAARTTVAAMRCQRVLLTSGAGGACGGGGPHDETEPYGSKPAGGSNDESGAGLTGSGGCGSISDIGSTSGKRFRASLVA